MKDLWPLAIGRVEENGDGTKKVHLPDLDAMDRVMAIQRKILAVAGLDR